MELRQILPGVRRWELVHPEWTPDDAADGGWEPVVASYLLDTSDGLVLIDPLAPSEGTTEREAFWTALDAEIEQVERAPNVLITLFWHARSAREVLDRYSGTRVWAHEPAAELVGERVRYTDTFRPGDRLPGGIEAIDVGRAFEVALFLPEHGALVTADVLLGAEDGGARLMPATWLRDRDFEQFRAELRKRLLALPVEHLLLTHGPAILGGGQAALARALQAPSAA